MSLSATYHCTAAEPSTRADHNLRHEGRECGEGSNRRGWSCSPRRARWRRNSYLLLISSSIWRRLRSSPRSVLAGALIQCMPGCAGRRRHSRPRYEHRQRRAILGINRRSTGSRCVSLSAMMRSGGIHRRQYGDGPGSMHSKELHETFAGIGPVELDIFSATKRYRQLPLRPRSGCLYS